MNDSEPTLIIKDWTELAFRFAIVTTNTDHAVVSSGRELFYLKTESLLEAKEVGSVLGRDSQGDRTTEIPSVITVRRGAISYVKGHHFQFKRRHLDGGKDEKCDHLLG
jgi:hypothetical protein